MCWRQGKRFTIEVLDVPDVLGRARFVLRWIERVRGAFRRELAPDGLPIGFRRSQVLRMNVESFAEHLRSRGARVQIRDVARRC